MREQEKMWQFPWGYRESIIVVAGVTTVGFLLQLTIGAFDFSLLQWPVNIIVGGVILMIIGSLLFIRKTHLFRWIAGVPLAVTLICAIVLLGIVMGVTPQIFHGALPGGGLASRLGFDNMTGSWPFISIYCMILLSLGATIAGRMFRFRWRDYAFYLNHLGLWILLLCAGLGAADIKRYVMHVREGETQWRVYNDNGDILDLPVAIELIDFRMDYYPPSLAIIDRATGAVQPGNRPQYFSIDEKRPEGRLNAMEIFLEDYIHNAVRDSDSTYREINMPGASPAARVKVHNPETGHYWQGWVCSGNMSQLFMTLNLEDNMALVMLKPEPKEYISEVNVYTEDGKSRHAIIEVNKPLKMGGWMLYQYDYDKDAGKLSAYSSIELVYDPWIIPVYVGIIMLMIGSVCMLWIKIN